MFSRIPYLEIFTSCRSDIKLIEVYRAIYRENLLIAYRRIFEDTERQSSYCIGCYSGDIHKCCDKKPTCLDEYPCNKRCLDDTKRRFLIFGRSCSVVGDNTFYDGKEDHKSQSEISKVLYHIPKLPERSVEMKHRCIDEGVVQSQSSNDQKRP